MDGRNKENNASGAGRLNERQINQKPMARSVAKKLEKLRARLAKKGLEEKAFSTPPAGDEDLLESRDGR